VQPTSSAGAALGPAPNTTDALPRRPPKDDGHRPGRHASIGSIARAAGGSPSLSHRPEQRVSVPDAVIPRAKLTPRDAVLTDIRMPATHTIEGIEAAKQIRADYPKIDARG